MGADRNDLGSWFPRLADSGVPVPRTEIVRTGVDLTQLLDGVMPEGYGGFLTDLESAARRIGPPPYFLRTGHMSGKHGWRRTCYVEDVADLPAHIAALVELSELADILGLPTGTWAVRELLPLRASFAAFDGMPVARELRAFFRDGRPLCLHPYWPEDAVRGPTVPDWRERLAALNAMESGEAVECMELVRVVAARFEGAWSVDFAQHEDGRWFAVDMAGMDRSFHWPGCRYAGEEKGCP